MPSSAYVIFVTHADKVLPHDAHSSKIWMTSLRKAAPEWATSVPDDGEWHGDWPRPAVAFRVVLHCESQYESAMKARLAQVAVKSDSRQAT